jgi:AcrR family transcriptional regulator
MAETEGLRERTRRAVQADIAATAMELFLAHGFDAVTMDQIAQQAGVSRRSLFRYFGTKEDLVLGNLAERGRESAGALRSRPDHEPPWTALRQALEVVVRSSGYSPERAFKVSTMVHRTPSLRARRQEKQLLWLDFLVPEIRRRLTGDDADLRAQAIVSSALACLDTATEIWLQRNGEGRIEQLYDEAVAAVRESH